MAITLYRRHGSNCEVHSLGLTNKAKRQYLDCQCPLWVYGRTDKDDVPRQSTGLTDLKAARQLVAKLEAEGKDETVHGYTIAVCVEKYLASREHELSSKTYGHHRLLLKRLDEFCASRGLYHIADLNVDVLEDFKMGGLPDMADTTKATSVAKLRCFLKDAFRRGWITENLVERIRTHRAQYETKLPFTEDEVSKILDEALRMDGGTHGYAKHPKTFRLLLELMNETGLRVSDAVMFNPRALLKGDTMWIYSFIPVKSQRVKKAKPVEAFLSDRMKKEIDECVWLSPDRPFVYRSSANPSYLCDQVYERMQNIGTRCGVLDCRPHRLRDAFAVRLLTRGVQLEDVSRLLGHASVAITEKHYAPWIAARKRRLERLLCEALMHA